MLEQCLAQGEALQNLPKGPSSSPLQENHRPRPLPEQSAPREELRVAEAILPFFLLPPMECKSYKGGAQEPALRGQSTTAC